MKGFGVSKIEQAFEAMCRHLLRRVEDNPDGSIRVVTLSGGTYDVRPGSVEGALWLLNHFTRGVQIDANTDSYEFIGPQRWTVRVHATRADYGSGIGRSFEEAVWRAFWHMFNVPKPVDDLISCGIEEDLDEI